MHRERAETFLRLLAEAELRRATAQPGDREVVAGCASRVMRVAGALTAVQVFGEEVTGPVMDDFELALGTRQIRSPAGYGRGLRSWMGPAPPCGTPPVPDVAILIGQVIPVHGEEVSGKVTLLSYAQTASGALLTLVARPSPCPRFTATDDRGASYQMSYHGNSIRPGEWTLRLYPDPPRDLNWLDLNTTPGEPAARIDLTPATRPAVTVSPVTRSPGEQLLTNIAMRLLATGSVFPQFGARRLRGRRGRASRPRRDQAHDPRPDQLRQQHHAARPRQRPDALLRPVAGTEPRADHMDPRQPRTLARHARRPTSRGRRHDPPAGGAAVEPRHRPGRNTPRRAVG